METIIKQWKKRNLTPVGKISLIKPLLISQFNHLFISLPDPSDKLIKEMRNTMFEFLWNNKPDKIKRDTLCADFDEGGLKMIDIKAFKINMDPKNIKQRGNLAKFIISKRK